ncbi:MAG: hypothetical protein QM755_14525 [Luteolibacter sp.]
MNQSVPFLLVGGVIVLAIVLQGHRHSRAQELLEDWAAGSGYQLLDYEVRTMLRGPFWLNSSKSQIVYRITIRDRDGLTMHGWVRCGGWLFGLLEDEVEVRWD